MGTKNNPGSYDCYAHAHPEEPLFILLGRDPVAASMVRLWAEVRAELGMTSQGKLAESYESADKIEAWSKGLGKDTKAAEIALRRVIARRVMDHLEKA
jgi:hypothetical protein